MSFWVREHCSVCLTPPPAMCSLDAQLSPTLRPHGLYPTRLLWPWDSPGKNTGMGCHFLLQEIFPIQVPNLCRLHLLHWQADSLLLAPPGQHRSVYHTAYLGQSVSSVAQSCPTLCDPTDCSTPGLPVHYHLLEFTQTHVHWVGDGQNVHWVQPSHSLSSPSPTFNLSQHQGLFKWVSSHQVAKVLEFQLQHQSFQWIFRTDFL